MPIVAAVERAANLLPHQGILENFIHRNPLEDLESLSFKDALDHEHQLESYMSPGERVFVKTQVDPRKRVNEALVDLSSAFLDRGAAKWAPSYRHKGFLYFFASLEGLGFAPWRKQARSTAQRILTLMQQKTGESQSISETIIQENLEFFGIPPEEHTQAIRSMLLELRGWAGMMRRMEAHPLEAPPNTTVRLLDFCAVQSILARSSIEALARESGWNAAPPVEKTLGTWLRRTPTIRAAKEDTALHSSALAYMDQFAQKREVLETQFKYTLLHAIGTKPSPQQDQPRHSVQLFTCIDDREGSLRRHVEESNPKHVETFGVAGFFGIPIRYRPADGREEMVLAPDGQTPTAVLVESEFPPDHDKTVIFNRRRKFLSHLSRLWEEASFSPPGSLLLTSLLPLSIARLLLMGYSPYWDGVVKNFFSQTLLAKPRTDFQLPFPAPEAATLLARTFNDIGMCTQHRFAPIVVVLGHGATSVNNPFAAAYNCGACGGREGGPNARLLARLVNSKEVRQCLLQDHGIPIPDDTVFVGGLHNTSTDSVEFFDVDLMPESHKDRFADLKHKIDIARGKNALERCDRFLRAGDVHTAAEALRHVASRAADAAEVRPELNHSTNAAVVIGRRDLTKGHFLDRRVFLPSYDPFADDDAGTNLEHVLNPALIVCSGINLEYLFSTIGVDHHGAGTKAPLNIVGNIGVLQGMAGDLRPGLPSQMTEMHTPVRALFIVDAPIERVEAVLARRERLRQLVRNEWVRFFVRVPETGRFYRQSHGEYLPVDDREMTAAFVPFTHHRQHGLNITRREDAIYWTAAAGMVLACAAPLYLYGADSMNPHGPMIALCGTLLSLPVLSYSRRYLHGEFMFGRFSMLCVGLLLGFNLVSCATSLEHALTGWSLFGFASTFLIGAYNDRPTVRNNATFAFTAYRISDLAMLVAATFSAQQAAAGVGVAVEHPNLVAGGLLVAALMKSSQLPLSALFARSMEGPTPASALGYAGLSAHVGTVLLASTMPLWFGFDWARITLASVGLASALHGTLVAKTRAERKGAVANATSATVGLILVTLALGYSDTALLMSLGHAAFRMRQILLAPSMIADSQDLRSALGYMPWPKTVPDWMYRLSWALRRLETDSHFMHAVHRMTSRVHMPEPWKLTKLQQWGITGVAVTLAGAPFTPVSHYVEEQLMHLLPTQPYLATALMVGHLAVSVALIRFLLVDVLTARRFMKKTNPDDAPK